MSRSEKSKGKQKMTASQIEEEEREKKQQEKEGRRLAQLEQRDMTLEKISKEIREIEDNKMVPNNFKFISEFNKKENILEKLEQLIIEEAKYDSSDKKKEEESNKSKYMNERLSRIESSILRKKNDYEIEILTKNLKNFINKILLNFDFISFVNIKKMRQQENSADAFMIFLDSLMIFPGLHISFGSNTHMHLTINFPYDWNFRVLLANIKKFNCNYDNIDAKRISFLIENGKYVIQIKYMSINKKNHSHSLTFNSIDKLVDYIFEMVIGSSKSHIRSMYTKPKLREFIGFLFLLLNQFQQLDSELNHLTDYFLKRQGKGNQSKKKRKRKNRKTQQKK